MSSFSPVAVVFSDKHAPSVVNGFAQLRPDVQVYAVHRDGLVETVRGPEVKSLTALNTKHVVWVGVPNRWATEHVGSTSLHTNHHVGSRARFSEVRETVLINRAVDQAFEALVRDADRAAEAEQKALVEAQNMRRTQQLGAKPPWYIPESLR